MMEKQLDRHELAHMAWRSFLIQACWNFDKMQNMGFAFSLLPALRKIFKDKEEIKDALKRHLGFFNSHPYLSVFAIGVVAGMEEERKKERDLSVESIQDFKNSLVGPLGAIGDTFFWASLRPTATLLAIGYALMGRIWAPIIFVFFYNVPHLYFRFKGIGDGYNLKTQVISRIKDYQFYKYADILKDLGMIIAGYIIGLAVNFEGVIYVPQSSYIILIGLLNFGLVAIFAFFMDYGISFYKILWFLILFSVLAGYLGFLG